MCPQLPAVELIHCSFSRPLQNLLLALSFRILTHTDHYWLASCTLANSTWPGRVTDTWTCVCSQVTPGNVAITLMLTLGMNGPLRPNCSRCHFRACPGFVHCWPSIQKKKNPYVTYSDFRDRFPCHFPSFPYVLSCIYMVIFDLVRPASPSCVTQHKLKPLLG